MSYARFSSDDWKSDVYVYEDYEHFWQIWVASSRYVFKDELPPVVELPMRDADKDMTEEEAKIAFSPWVDRILQVMTMVKDADTVPINGPYDGEGFRCDSPGECADQLEKLIAAGYHVPDGVIAELREEQANA